jgi:hypothetical protein
MLLSLLSLLATARPGDPALDRGLEAIQTRAIQSDVAFLASDELAGRDTPSPGLTLAARFVRARLMRLSFEPAGDHGYFDEYALESKRLDVERTYATLVAGAVETPLGYGDDYVFPDREVADVTLDAPLVYAGTGSAAELEGKRFEGAWALAEDSELSWRDRLAAVRASGALGLVVVQQAGEKVEPMTRRFGYWGFRARAGTVSLPGAAEGEALFPQLYVNRGPLAALLGDAPMAVGSPLPGRIAHARTVAEGQESVTVENVCGLWPGSDPELKHEVLVVSAHLDHVGLQDGEIHNGADDNGSGSSALLALAEALAAHGPLSRSVLLLWVSGEEKGLLGSQAWTLAPTLPEGYRAVADINIDMVGRNAPDKLLVTPTAKLPEHNGLVPLAESHAAAEGFAGLGSCDTYWTRSDHKSFADNLGIPVMFLFSDVHEDYHKPTDDADKIDCDKIRRVARLVLRVLADLQEPEIL